MSIYDPLRRYLQDTEHRSLMLAFSEIEDVIGRPLPRSAYDYSEWWSNEDPDKTTHTQSKAWTTIGFNAEVDRARKLVTFRRRQA